MEFEGLVYYIGLFLVLLFIATGIDDFFGTLLLYVEGLLKKQRNLKLEP